MSDLRKRLTFLRGRLLAAALLSHRPGRPGVRRGMPMPIPNSATDRPVRISTPTQCGPCQAMKPAIDGLLQAGYPVERINVDENRPGGQVRCAARIPCFVMVQDGRETDRVVGQTNYARLEAMFQRPPHPVAKPSRHPPQSNSRSRASDAAWRYERPIGAAGHRANLLPGRRTHAGRSAAARWSAWKGRLLILTARHVVQDAKKILVRFSTGKTHRARVLSVDRHVGRCGVWNRRRRRRAWSRPSWNWATDAKQTEGDRLESCGYGPDGKLACNSGLFLGYRRSSVAPHGPDDWMVISGHARGGDSGGPIFNHRGRIVGVLWGTDGRGRRRRAGRAAARAAGRGHFAATVRAKGPAFGDHHVNAHAAGECRGAIQTGPLSSRGSDAGRSAGRRRRREHCAVKARSR